MQGADSSKNTNHQERKWYSRIVIGLTVISLLVVAAFVFNTHQTDDVVKSVQIEQHDLTNDIREMLTANPDGVRGLDINADTITTLRVPGNKGIRFGQTVAVEGNIAVVGAPKAKRFIDLSGNRMYKGGVLVLRRHPLTKKWKPIQKLTVRQGYAFGYKVTLARRGRTMYLAGSSIQDDAVHLFKMVRGKFVYVQKIKPEDELNWTGFGSSFGTSVTMDGKFLVVGARHETVNGLYYFGGVYIYKFNPNKKKFVFIQRVLSRYNLGHFDVVTSMSKSRPGMLVVGSMAGFGKVRIMKFINGQFRVVKVLRSKMRVFGSSISLQGKYLAVGAYLPQLNGAGVKNAGFVFLYKEVARNKWVRIKTLTRGKKSGLGFGSSVKLTTGLNMIVGAELASKGKGSGRGAVFAYSIKGRSVKYLGSIYSPSTRRLNFGKSLAISGQTMIVGGYGDRGRGIAVIYC